MRCIDADKLYPDCMTKNGTLAISQNQIANAPAIKPKNMSMIDETTNKRVIDILEWLLANVDENGRIDVGSWYYNIDKDFKEALSVAIKALKNEPFLIDALRKAGVTELWV